MANIIYIPTLPTEDYQNKIAIKLQEKLIANNYSPGLMLVILGGKKGLENSNVHYSNLKKFDSVIKDWRFVTLLSCFPCRDLDLLNEPALGLAHIKDGIDYTANIPFDVEKELTFHLGSLVTSDEFLSRDKKGWHKLFYDVVVPVLKKAVDYSKDKGVKLKVESTPVPEFGDVPDADLRTYQGIKLNELRNPFYITRLWGFEQIKELGLGICLDICHNRTIYEVARYDIEKKESSNGILFSEDVNQLSNASLLEDVAFLDSLDLIHLNDGRGIYSNIKKTTFEEGVTLGEGEIVEHDQIISLIEVKKIPFVLEINETDFRTKSNTKQSIDYLLKK